MRVASFNLSIRIRQRAFTLLEVMVAGGLGTIVAGSAVLLLLQSAVEQGKGLAGATVEDKAYVLQANLSSCLRSMSCDQGLTPDYSSKLTDGDGNVLGYQTVYCFQANTNGSYTTERISFNSVSGQVVYTPDLLKPAQQIVWMTNGPNAALRLLCFSTSFNPDGSLNSSFVNVRFLMDDNGYALRNRINNPASIYRTFSIQMRSD